MTGRDRPVCDRPEPCGCYAEGYAAGSGDGDRKRERVSCRWLRTTRLPVGR